MIPTIGTPIVVFGPIHNGTREHAALVTRVFAADPERSVVNAVMFPDGGGDHQFHRELHLYPTRELALAAGPSRVSGYYVVSAPQEPAPEPALPPAPAPAPVTARGRGRPRKNP